MKKLPLFVGIVVVLLVLILPVSTSGCAKEATSPAPATTTPSAAAVKPVVLKIDMAFPKGHPNAMPLERWFNEVQDLTEKRVTFDRYYGGSLVKVTEQLEACQQGIVDVMTIPNSYVAGKIPLTQAMMVPIAGGTGMYGFREWRATNDIWEREYAKFNVKWLGAYMYGDDDFISKNKAIKTANDFKGMVVRDPGGGATGGQQFTLWGATPVSVGSWQEVYVSLQRGMAEGTRCSPSSYYAMKLNEVAPYYTQMSIRTIYMLTAINMAKWNNISEQDQKIIMKSFYNFQPWGFESSWVIATTYREMNKKVAKEYVIPTKEVMEELMSKLKPMFDKYATDLGPDAAKILDLRIKSGSVTGLEIE